MKESISIPKYKISIIGLGKVGSSMLATFASKGYQVIGVDLNADIVKKVNEGVAPVNETGLDELLEKYKDNITSTQSYEEAILNSNISFIIVPTPSKDSGEFSTQFVEKAIEQIGKVLKYKSSYHLIVLTSTVLPGSSEEKILPFLESAVGRKCGLNFGYCYSPLFIALGSVIKNIISPDMVLIGGYDARSSDILESFYKTIVDNNAPIARMNIVNAELTKISVNSYITTKISFANTLADICENLPGSDVDVISQAVGLDSRIGNKYLKAGLGFGGPCFPRDNAAFSFSATSIGASAPLAVATHQMNQTQIDRVIKKLIEFGGKLEKVAVLGLAYKLNTAVTEESQGLEIATKLISRNLDILIFDPMSKFMDKKQFSPKIKFAKSAQECLNWADAIIITLPYDEFKITPEQLPKGKYPVIIDCWRILSPNSFLGKASYFAIGAIENPLLNFNKLRKQKVVVCGAGGFIGGHLVKDLLDKGYSNIRAVDIKPLGEWYQPFSEVENLQLDLREKSKALKALKNADMVYNFAADMGGMGFIESNRAVCMLNVLINTNLLQAAVHHGVKRYFFASSACVYSTLKQGSPDIVGLKESDAYPAMPEDGYGWEKLFSERMCKHFMEDFELKTSIARFHNIYGPFGYYHGGREKAPAAICRKVIEAKLSGSNKIEIWGDGNQTRSFTYVDDCIEGVHKILLSDTKEPINLGSSEKVTINQLVDIVEEIAQIKLARVYNLAAPRGVAGRNSDNTLIKSKLGWEPSTPLKVGLSKTYQWIYDQMISKTKTRSKFLLNRANKLVKRDGIKKSANKDGLRYLTNKIYTPHLPSKA